MKKNCFKISAFFCQKQFKILREDQKFNTLNDYTGWQLPDKSWKLLEIAGNCWKLLEMAGTGWKWQKLAGNGQKRLK